MYDKSLIVEMLHNIETSLSLVIEQTQSIRSVSDFVSSPAGMFRLDGVCMNLLVVGETVKVIDKRTNRKLLSEYPSVPWTEIMGMRDKIAHHYFEIDADAVFDILKNDIPFLLTVIKQMKENLSK
jgi:uncharacterized protein with HEPN domain